MNKYQTQVSIGDVDEVPVIVEYEWIPASIGSTDGRYGPKLEPDEPAHVELQGVTLTEDGRDIELTEDQEGAIVAEIEEHEEASHDQWD